MTPQGHVVKVPEHYPFTSKPLFIDNKSYTQPLSFAEIEGYVDPRFIDPQKELKYLKLDDYVNSALYPDVKNVIPYADGNVPLANTVHSRDEWRPHNNEALAKFYKKNRRLPNGLNSSSFNEFWFDNSQPYDDLPF